MVDKKILRELVNTGRRVEEAGLIIGEDGNISARSGNVVYIKRRSASMGKAKITDYIPIDIKTGKTLRKKDKPSTEIYMHLACYRERKDVGAVIHTHPVFATAIGIANVGIRPLSYETAANLNSHIARIGYFPPGTPELGKPIGRAIKRHNAILIRSHGLVTVGKDLEEAFLRNLAVERAALTYISCKVLGRVGFLKRRDYLKFFHLPGKRLRK